MFIVILELDNGYRCGCCRREWITYEILDTEEDVKEYILSSKKEQDRCKEGIALLQVREISESDELTKKFWDLLVEEKEQ